MGQEENLKERYFINFFATIGTFMSRSHITAYLTPLLLNNSSYYLNTKF